MAVLSTFIVVTLIRIFSPSGRSTAMRVLLLNRYLICLVATLLANTITIARDDDDESKISFPVKLETLSCLLVDDDGTAIEGAVVEIFGVRCAEDPSSWYDWPSQNAGPASKVKSDETGKVELSYPIRYGSPELWRTTTTLHLKISHPRFVSKDPEFKLNKWPEKIALTKGASLSVSALGNDGKRIEKIFPLTLTSNSRPKWVFDTNKTSSHSLPSGESSFLFVAPSHGDVTYFSQLISADLDPTKPVELKDVVLAPGKRIFGKLPDNVPRPIVDGFVSINVLFEGTVPGQDSAYWETYCPIKEDGSFEVLSVPGPGKVQVIALCRGWVIEDFEKNLCVNGRTFDLTQKDVELQVEFPMEQTGELTVEVIDSEGTAIEGVVISTWPNKEIIGVGTTNLDRKLDMAEMIKSFMNGVLPSDYWRSQDSSSRYSQKTDKKGMVTLRDIPCDSKQRLAASHSDYFVAPNFIADKNGRLSYTTFANETVELLIVMDKRDKK
jgi:hypothetical protein